MHVRFIESMTFVRCVARRCMYSLADCLVKLKRTAELKALQVELRPFLSLLPKAKTAKIVSRGGGGTLR